MFDCVVELIVKVLLVLRERKIKKNFKKSHFGVSNQKRLRNKNKQKILQRCAFWGEK